MSANISTTFSFYNQKRLKSTTFNLSLPPPCIHIICLLGLPIYQSRLLIRTVCQDLILSFHRNSTMLGATKYLKSRLRTMFLTTHIFSPTTLDDDAKIDDVTYILFLISGKLSSQALAANSPLKARYIFFNIYNLYILEIWSRKLVLS